MRSSHHSFQAGQGARGCSGFTLLEIIIVIALIGLLTAMVTGGAVALLRDHPATGEDELKLAILRCRRRAVSELEVLHLSYDEKARSFIETSREGEKLFPISMPGELKVDFLAPETSSSQLLGGDLVEQDPLRSVSFYPDGASSAFRVQLRTGGPARILSFDPWTCAEIETKRK